MEHKIKSVAVYCGSSAGFNEVYRQSAEEVAACFIENDITLVYGGATVGTMGTIADRVLSGGGKVIGVIPQSLVKMEIAHHGLTHLHIVDSMHERKALIAELAQGFMMLPGGAGSLDEFFEVCTWSQLGFHGKPCGILNTNRYYDHLLKFLDHTVQEGFIKAAQRKMILVDESPSGLLRQFFQYDAPAIKKWISDRVVEHCS